jgi:hypothetical protein
VGCLSDRTDVEASDTMLANDQSENNNIYGNAEDLRFPKGMF